MFGQEAEVARCLRVTEMDVNHVDPGHLGTALACAGYACAAPVVRLLLERKDIDVNRMRGQKSWETPPLLAAAAGGSEEIVHMLLDRPEIDAEAEDASGRNALMFAADRGKLGAVKVLLSRTEIDVNCESAFGSAVAMALNNWHEDVVHYMVTKLSLKLGHLYKSSFIILTGE